jgi:hypothetical protein
MVHNCTTSNTSTNSFSVRCAEGFNGGLPQSFLLEVRESNSQELRANLTSPVPRFSVTHLESGALYQACIYAYNDKGRSEAMVVQAGTLRLPEKQLTSDSGECKVPGRAIELISRAGIESSFRTLARPIDREKRVSRKSVMCTIKIISSRTLRPCYRGLLRTRD